MDESLRLGRIRGIPVGINWSLLLVFALIAAAVAGGRLPEAHPGHEPGVYVGAGVVAAVLLFASILVHELGHALLAQRRGIEVEGIVLWLFGGVSKFASEPTSPRDALHIAAIGPLLSLVVAVGFVAATLAAEAVGVTSIAVEVGWWLAVINVVLAVFNLLPAAPLDGGRILRALLWYRFDDGARAAQTAARAGRVLGLTLIGLGIVEFAFGAGLGGIWLALIGFFLLTAARAEETRAKLEGIRVADVMVAEPVTAPDWLTVETFVDDYVFAHQFSTFPLRAFDGSPSGILPLDLVKRVPADRRREVRLRDIACPMDRVPTARPEEDLVEALPRMAGTCSRGRLLVVEDGELIGLVSPTDVARVADTAELASARRSPELS